MCNLSISIAYYGARHRGGPQYMFINQCHITPRAVGPSKKGRIQEGKLVGDGEPWKTVYYREASDEGWHSSKAQNITEQVKTILTQNSSDPISKWGIVYNLPGIKPQVRVLYRTLQNVIVYVTYIISLKNKTWKDTSQVILTMVTLGEWNWVGIEFYFLYFCCILFCFVKIQLFYN